MSRQLPEQESASTPAFYHELVDSTEKGFAFRQRYWLRSYLGYTPVRDALPNTTHYALAALQYSSIIPKLITQNVDGLHHKALSSVWNTAHKQERILELHGSLHKVHCSHGHVMDRATFQDRLSAANPEWKTYVDELEATGQRPRTNPDGDVELEGIAYDSFRVPECATCLAENRHNSILKPELIFFGESIRQDVRDRSYADIEHCSRLFLVGTTLATYSAFRLLRHALELKKPVLMLNIGPTRADPLSGLEKIEMSSRIVMRDAVRAVLGSRVDDDPIIERMLRSGVVQPPSEDD
ncbi:hypothetical protein EW026_g6498 [Hermanssonia centrifuga]|uniref:Deacetylase sirtuin-type domain-containing protein n=1 Tax=Hermanssonia centrifuga TaxID=98765 RepID=A0A4S4KF75_9APHY|nr:hypothetical protein EW026_g6498 [Hermanssonia centrifuga]